MAGNRAIDRVTLASHTDNAELHNDRTRLNSAAAGCFVADANDALHVLSLLKKHPLNYRKIYIFGTPKSSSILYRAVYI